MARQIRPPMVVIAVALMALMATLAALQYRWLGQISDAERARLRASIDADAAGFADDFDRELTRAYLLFQVDPGQDEPIAARIGSRYDRWTATARFPKMIRDVFIVQPASGGLQRFSPSTRFLEPAEWPAALLPLRAGMTQAVIPSGDAAVRFLRNVMPPVWPGVPALVVPVPMVLVTRTSQLPALDFTPKLSYTVLLLDDDYMKGTMLPALAQQHFRAAGDVAYEVAVLPPSPGPAIYRSDAGFTPTAQTPVDGSTALFRVRTQDFPPVAAEVTRFASFTATVPGGRGGGSSHTFVQETIDKRMASGSHKGPASLSVVMRSGTVAENKLIAAAGAATRVMPDAPSWHLVVQHPSGSLERAVSSARRRNLVISSSILGILGLSVAFLFASTRRAQALARQQIEFVATVSHELRTPLAVIRSAADNLADGVVADGPGVREYGELVRREGLRLSDLVEQVLEFAGLQSDRRHLRLQPVDVVELLREIVAAARVSGQPTGVTIEISAPSGLPPANGDPAALRRVFQNLVGNAVKYGREGGWIGITAAAVPGAVVVTVRDRGAGIDPAIQDKIFDPFYRAPAAVSAQVQGAGLGLTLVRRIVEAHGGRVTVSSAPGSGSAFIVTLPSVGPSRGAAARATDIAPQAS